MEIKPLIYLLLISGGACQVLKNKCPKNSNIDPCTCKTYFNNACIITCSLATQEDVDRIADIPNLCDGKVHFVLVNSFITGISSKLWKQLLSSRSVDVSIKHSGVDGLVRPGDDPIGRVYTTGSAVIKIDHTTVKNWNWKQFSDFYSEDELTIVVDDSKLPEINSEFSEIASGQVHKITIDSAGLSKIEDKQFVIFDDLNSLSLQNNKLTSVSRSMLARPAKKLQFLHLNGNLLTSIPGDLFADMPLLEVVYLRDNKLKSLPQELFKSITSSHMKRIDLVYNPWECDCRLMWILKKAKSRWNMGVCASPEELVGIKVRNLGKLLNC